MSCYRPIPAALVEAPQADPWPIQTACACRFKKTSTESPWTRVFERSKELQETPPVTVRAPLTLREIVNGAGKQ